MDSKKQFLPIPRRRKNISSLAGLSQWRFPESPAVLFDPEMLYIECKACGRPVLWEQGKTTDMLAGAGIEPGLLDESCMVLSDGCPLCRPEESVGFILSVVRVAGLSADDHLKMVKPGGHA